MLNASSLNTNSICSVNKNKCFTNLMLYYLNIGFFKFVFSLVLVHLRTLLSYGFLIEKWYKEVAQSQNTPLIDRFYTYCMVCWLGWVSKCLVQRVPGEINFTVRVLFWFWLSEKSVKVRYLQHFKFYFRFIYLLKGWFRTNYVSFHFYLGQMPKLCLFRSLSAK